MNFMVMAWEYDTDHAAYYEGERHPRVKRHVEALTRVVEKRSVSGATGLVLEFGLGPGGKTFRRKGGKPLLLDGPFAETKEQLAGLDIIDFQSRADAIEYAKSAFAHESHVTEIRPVLEMWWIQNRGPRPDSKLFALLMRGDENREDLRGASDSILNQHWGVTREYIGQRRFLEPYVWGGVRLHPSAQTTAVRLQNGAYVATDGPFSETKEVIGGLTLIDCPSMDEALEWAQKYAPREGDVIEVREIAGGPLLFCHS
jgi:hypothetical protein